MTHYLASEVLCLNKGDLIEVCREEKVVADVKLTELADSRGRKWPPLCRVSFSDGTHETWYGTSLIHLIKRAK